MENSLSALLSSMITTTDFEPPSGWTWFPVLGPAGPWGWACLRPPDLQGGQDEPDHEMGTSFPDISIYRGTDREPRLDPKTVPECNVEEHVWTSWTTESLLLGAGAGAVYCMVRKCLRCLRVETA